MKLDELIKAFRIQEGLTMQEFADRCGLSKGYVSMLEKGQHPQRQRPLAPSLETYKKIATGMSISLDTLLYSLDGDEEVTINSNQSHNDSSAQSMALSTDEAQLIEDYRGLTPPGQEYIRQTMAMAKQSYAGKNNAVPNVEIAE